MPAQVPQQLPVEHDRVVAPEDAELPRRARGLLAGRAPHQLGHPGRALHVGDSRLVVPGRADALDDLAQRPQRDRGLAEARQHPLDVAHEDAARADDQHAAALVAPAVGVEQERGAVQGHHGLARARPAGDRDDPLAGSPDRLVLLGLDGGDDRVHRPVAGAGELRHQRALADDRQRGLGLRVEQLVLDPDDGRSRGAQHPPAYDVVRLGRGGLVEHGGRRGAPVDQQRVAVGVAQADPPDVARLGVDLLTQVQAPEDQPLVRGVELGDAARGLVDHRVPLDQTTLVPEPTAAVSLLGERGSGPGRLPQLHVDPIHERLLGSDLSLHQLFRQRLSSPRTCNLASRQAYPAATSSGSGTPSSRPWPPPRRTAARRSGPSRRRARRCGRPGPG